jgi:uncharacterized protein YceK
MKHLRAAACLTLLVFALAASGCGTINDMTMPGGQRILGGTRADASNISQPSSSSPDVQRVFCILDFPFSLVLDLALLPVTVIIALFRTSPN